MKKIEVTMTEAKQKAAKKDKSGMYIISTLLLCNHLHMKHNKGAMFALKRKKMYEGEVTKLQGAKISLESQAMALESASVNVEILKSMKSATDAMKQTRQNM